MNIPDNLQYTAEHVWIRPAENGNWLVGITDYAQDLLGDIVYVETPAPGTSIEAGQPCGLIESVKTGSDLHAPLSGTVTAINDALQSTPELINDKPYDAWIFSFKPASESANLLTAAEYTGLLG
ncbi:glycine cleavage system H protein [Methylobacillus rhizosphaerae]|uniref:Glycine cleavage system H protein n=1 Tax=Methylobacillus rhizosphaerae TaxID=551994 RepID=A0A238Z554_9PROT|nr:glycine cleavage system protein GcvH [Methylobacillus rhizosphaerae]SNR78496.1 glycine cleavage system H protein [Methylobacillus rhizosphaerae]